MLNYIHLALKHIQTKNQTKLMLFSIIFNPVADSWAGAETQKELIVQKFDGWTDLPTDTTRCRVASLRLKMPLLQYFTTENNTE